MSKSAQPLTDAIVAFAAARGKPLPESARHVMKLSLLDWCAVAIAGREEPVAGIVRSLVAEEGGLAEATVIGFAERLPARAAALANGSASHALDYDDTHFAHIGHPSVAIVPAALAMAEKAGARGGEFLDAALIGVEASCRIGTWLGRQHYQHGFHQTATAGAFGATMAAARLLGLDAVAMAQALGIAATRASGLKSQFGTMGKPYHAGMAAANGIEAALLARAGFISRPDGLECEQGFAETHAGEGGDLAPIISGLGEIFWFETVQHKFHACCHGTHAAIEALNVIRLEHHLKPEEIASAEVTTHPRWLKVCNIEKPTTGLEAKFSYRLTSAMALSGRDTGALTTYTDALCAEPALAALRDRISVATDTGLKDTEAQVVVHLASGAELRAHHDLDRQIPAAAREAKIRAKASALLGANKADALWAVISEIDHQPVEALARLLNA